jgi:glucose-6-phosphate 1-dehydrogenase
VMTIQPDEGIALKFGAKRPGSGESVQQVVMDFKYAEGFNVPAPDAYERLILDAIIGDSTLFTRADEVEAAWALITPITAQWARGGGDAIEQYRSGSAGPRDADAMLADDGRKWRPL